MGFFAAVRRFLRIRRLSRVLGAEPNGDIRSFNRMSERKDLALVELLDLCESDPILSAVPRHGATRPDLREVYGLLINAGAGQWVAGHYVPVATFGDPLALHFVLANRGRLPWETLAVLLIERFEHHDTGPVVQETRGRTDPNDPSKGQRKRKR